MEHLSVRLLFVLQTADKEAPGLIRMQALAYLSGFPASFKETEQLRVKLPSVITNKIKQVKLFEYYYLYQSREDCIFQYL